MANPSSLEQLALNITCLKYLDELFRGINPALKIILLKGVSLLNTVYSRDLGSRHLGDVDILIRKEDFLPLKEYLSGKGYIFHNNIDSLGESNYLNSVTCRKEERFWPSFHIHWHLNNASSPNLAFSAKINLEKIWQEAQLLNGYKNIWIMSPHHQLIHLCEHALKHSYGQAYFLKDINRVIKYYQNTLDWNKLILEAQDFDLTRAVYYTLYFAHRLTGAEIPDFVLFSLKPKRFTFLEKRFMNAVLHNRVSSHLSDVVYLAMNKTIFNKLKFIFRAFIPPCNAMGQIKNSLPSRVNPLDYLMRLRRGFLYSLGMARALII